MSATQVYNLWRAVGEQFGIFTSLSGKRLRLVKIGYVNSETEVFYDLQDKIVSPGSICFNNLSAKDGVVFVRCKVKYRCYLS